MYEPRKIEFLCGPTARKAVPLCYGTDNIQYNIVKGRMVFSREFPPRTPEIALLLFKTAIETSGGMVAAALTSPVNTTRQYITKSDTVLPQTQYYCLIKFKLKQFTASE